ncbi:unnamed protein product [Phaedon cochleariae]|uniref:Guanine nucleotide-binding protein-like 1 n=1 Tax=Phaedon cochleariae TaxID=80249 RepID=A0A9P0DQK8_PHACE|nr:unnamed protein product [Phaedon cochleariae]
MPQGRKKTPFSGKAKKEQLKAKKQSRGQGGRNPVLLKNPKDAEGSSNIQKINFQPTKDGRSRPNRYALQFFRESNEEKARQKEIARHSLEPKDEKDLEIDGDQFFEKVLDFPKRPPWNFELGKDELESQENRYFTGYLNEIEKNYDWKELSLFELNLETWRQLWRVLEMSDIILFIVDIRFSAIMFPPSLYEYVTKTLKKDFILVLNKIDLAPASLVVAWKHYFQNKYPNLHIVMFTTVPGYNLVGKQSDKAGLQVRRRKGRIRMAAEGTQQILEVCQKLVGDKVDLSSWQKKIKEEMSDEVADSEDDGPEIGETLHVKSVDTQFYQYQKFNKGVLTVGCVGQPNVGKSSLMNAMMGKKVVSVSRTPGHTKHFQTIFLTPNVKLCDCPGLIFPSKVQKPLQVLMGSFPIAQLSQPFIAVKYLAERLDLVSLLRIEHPDNDDTWSAMDICDGWAKKRGFLTAHAARLDTYRAANSLLRMALDGKICLCLRPPSYAEKKEYWASHPEVKTVKWIQARSTEEEPAEPHFSHQSDLSDEESIPDREIEDGNDSGSEDSEESEGSSEEEQTPFSANKFALLGPDD